MKNKNAYFIGKGFIILLHVITMFLLYGYALIACSTRPDNILNAPYEPSGLQVLYYFLVLPVLFGISIIEHAIKRGATKERAMITFFPMIMALSFFLFLTFIETFIGLSKGKGLFYYGSLSLFFGFSVVSLWVLFSELKALVYSYLDLHARNE